MATTVSKAIKTCWHNSQAKKKWSCKSCLFSESSPHFTIPNELINILTPIIWLGCHFMSEQQFLYIVIICGLRPTLRLSRYSSFPFPCPVLFSSPFLLLPLN